MSHYIVTFTTTASVTVEVDASDEDEAEELAYNTADFPFFPGGMNGDLGDWETSDVEEVER